MAGDDHKAQEQLTPEARRGLLRAFADRMLLKVTAMDDPEDMPGVERCVRVAAVIERIYSRCDRAEHHGPDPRKLEAERAQHTEEAIKARINLARTLEWEDKVRPHYGAWYDAAKAQVQPVPQPAPVAKAPETKMYAPAPVAAKPVVQPSQTPPKTPLLRSSAHGRQTALVLPGLPCARPEGSKGRAPPG